MRGAIILAGGQSKRFQDGSGRWADKALAILFGKPLLAHVIENVMPVVDEVILCVNNASRGSNYLEILRNYSITNVKICVDIMFPHVQGPSAAIATGLKYINADYCIILPCDTPFIKPSIVDYLLELAKRFDICAPIHPDGNIETLMFSCNRRGAAKIAEILCFLGRSKPVDIIRASSKIKLVSTISEIRKLDPDFKSFININFRSDLIELPTRVPKEGPVIESIDLNLAQPLPHELDIIESVAEKYVKGDYVDAINSLSRILRSFEGRDTHFWMGVLWETMGKILYVLTFTKETSKETEEYYVSGRMAFEKAAHEYAMETEIYRRFQAKFLLESANEDKMWCLAKRDEMGALG
ncbi:MAG: molybdenum cofactor guanylyltransferase [Candidatus Bathyarchaeia archaeon]|nr:molybdenum cofactor guanylyltransferase [Candidatus Bathyarchaeota archaeon]